MEQFQVIQQITLALGNMLEAYVNKTTGKKVRAIYEYEPNARKGDGSISVHFCGLTRRTGEWDREYEFGSGGGEQFRNPPLLLRGQYLLSTWAKPPEDQAILGAVLRRFLDHPFLDMTGEQEEVIAYAGIPAVDIAPLTVEENRTLQQVFGMPFAPSMCYHVDFRLQSAKTTPIKRVKERVIDYRKIEG